MDLSAYRPYKFAANNVSMIKLSHVTPYLQTRVLKIFVILESKGWQPIVAEGVRTLKEQQKKIDQGVSQLKNPKRSRHTTGDAVDIVDKRYGWEGPMSNLNHQFWKDLGKAAVEQGLEWGGNWKTFKDVAHVQVPRSIRP